MVNGLRCRKLPRSSGLAGIVYGASSTIVCSLPNRSSRARRTKSVPAISRTNASSLHSGEPIARVAPIAKIKFRCSLMQLAERRYRHPTPAPTPIAPRQLSMALDSVRLWMVSTSERRTALARLADLLMRAASATAEERADDKL